MGNRFQMDGFQQKCFFGLLAVGLLVFEVWSISSIASTQDWEASSGFVTRSEMVRRSRRSRSPEVEYTYHWQGHTYSNDDVAYGDIGSYVSLFGIDFSGALSRYPINSEVTVYVNPEAPEQSVLERDIPTSAYIVLVGSIAFLTWLVVSTFAGSMEADPESSLDPHSSQVPVAT